MCQNSPFKDPCLTFWNPLLPLATVDMQKQFSVEQSRHLFNPLVVLGHCLLHDPALLR